MKIVFIVANAWQVHRNRRLSCALGFGENRTLFISEENWTGGNALDALMAGPEKYVVLPRYQGNENNIFHDANPIQTIQTESDKAIKELRNFIAECVNQDKFILVQDGHGKYLKPPMSTLYYSALSNNPPTKLLFLQHAEANLVDLRALHRSFRTFLARHLKHYRIENWDYRVLVYSKLDFLLSLAFNWNFKKKIIVGNFNSFKFRGIENKEKEYEANGVMKKTVARNGDSEHIMIFSPGVLRYTAEFPKSLFLKCMNELISSLSPNVEITFKLKGGEDSGYLRENLVRKDIRIISKDVEEIDFRDCVCLVPCESNVGKDLLMKDVNFVTYRWSHADSLKSKTRLLYKALDVPEIDFCSKPKVYSPIIFHLLNHENGSKKKSFVVDVLKEQQESLALLKKKRSDILL